MRNKILLASVIFGCMTLSSVEANAGEPVKTTVGADLVSSYLFRGARLDGASIQPSVTLDWDGFSVGAWGSTGLTGDLSEIDFTAAWNVGDFTIGVTDYFCAGNLDKFFDFGKETLHVAEFNLGYDFGFMSLNWFTNFVGAMGQTPDGKKSYSSYIEVAAPFSLGGIDWSASLGVSPWGNDFYGVDKFSPVNCSITASKDVEIGSVTLPAFIQFASNPSTGHLFMVAGISF